MSFLVVASFSAAYSIHHLYLNLFLNFITACTRFNRLTQVEVFGFIVNTFCVCANNIGMVIVWQSLEFAKIDNILPFQLILNRGMLLKICTSLSKNPRSNKMTHIVTIRLSCQKILCNLVSADFHADKHTNCNANP